MEGIGERLKRKREEMGLSIEQAAEATKFRPEMIQAVEEGRPGVFSARVYQDGFIRGYAQMLGLDGEALVREQKSEEERAQEALRGIRIRPPSTSKLRRTALVVITVAVVGVLTSILIDRLVTRPRESGEEGSGAGQAAATDSVRRSTAAAGSRKMAYIPGSSREASADAADEAGAGGEAGPGAGLARPGAGGGERAEGSSAPGASPVTVQSAGASTPVSPGGQASGQPPGASQEQAAESKSLEVAAGRHSVYLILASGEQVIFDGWVYGGTRKMFRGHDLVVVSLSSTEGVSMVLEGRPVALPEAGPEGQKSIGDWPVR
jgi:cytoskeletal protein RodZ